jgi:hypothetical protein
MSEPVEIEGRPEGWRPSWRELLSMIEHFCREEETIAELMWLREHPIDWLMATRYMRKRVDNHIAEDRKYLRELDVTDPATGRPRREYLQAKNEVELRNARRLHFLAGIDAQTAEAKHLIGYDNLPPVQRAQIVAMLVELRAALISDHYDEHEALDIVNQAIHNASQEWPPS